MLSVNGPLLERLYHRIPIPLMGKCRCCQWVMKSGSEKVLRGPLTCMPVNKYDDEIDMLLGDSSEIVFHISIQPDTWIPCCI